MRKDVVLITLKKLCEQCNIPYDSKHSDRALKKLKEQYEIKQLSPRQYEIVRKLSISERASVSKYSKANQLLKDVICIELSKAPENTLRGNTKFFLEHFGIVNKKYKYFSYNNLNEDKIKFLESVPIDNACLSSFYEDVNPVLSNMLKTVFKKLEDELLIIVDTKMMFGEKTIFFDNETGEREIFLKNKEASSDEKEKFMKSAREKMLKLNYSKWSEVPYYQKKIINKQTCVELGWAYVYNDYVLTLNRSGIKQVTKERLNDEVCKKIYQSRQGNLKEYSRELITDCIDTIIKL